MNYTGTILETTLSEKNNNYAEAKRKDMFWVISFNLFNFVPMWTGWNTRRSENNPAKQLVCYMIPIQLPPTRIDVVKETMHRSQILAEQCGQNYALITFDLAIAKIAKRIQSEETTTFDNRFILFGSFHPDMSFFSSLGIKWTTYFTLKWYCSNGLHEQIFKGQNV